MMNKNELQHYIDNEKILFARIIDLPNYNSSVADINAIISENNAEGFKGANEIENFFIRKNNKVYGYTENQSERILQLCPDENSNTIDNCLVIFVTFKSKQICGYYKNAKVFREKQYLDAFFQCKDELVRRFGANDDYRVQYYFSTDSNNAVLLNEEERITVDTTHGLAIGQRNIKSYKDKNRDYIKKILIKLTDEYKEQQAKDYSNFFNMLKFWVQQTNNNIENVGKRIHFQEIKEGRLDEAEGKFTNPKFKREYLKYSNFSIRISFFRSGHYESERANYVVWKTDEGNSWYLAIRYLHPNEIFANYRYDLALEFEGDSKEFVEYMKNSNFIDGFRVTIDELELNTNNPNNQVKKLFNYFQDMIEYARSYSNNQENEIDKENAIDINLINKVRIEHSKSVIISKNVIFHGAPGTGKTYLSKEIAADIVSEGKIQKYDDLENEQKKQIEFIQFHPSYDYTDFVEGLRPDTTPMGEVGFGLKSGSFMNFVEQAKKKSEVGGQDNFDEAWDYFFDEVSDTENYNIKTITGKPIKNLLPYERNGMQGVYPEGTKKYLNHDQVYNVYKNLPGTPKRGFDNYRKAIVMHLKEKFDLIDYHEANQTYQNAKKYVFIIDEINRGEISKIFGELFFSIDPGYRGETGGVITQYSNMKDNPEDKFFIPNNVYIIGTMNDIDRSVDSFDFAMRRRFRFIELKSNDQIEMLDCLKDKKEKAIKRMKALNDKISETDELNDNYHIGPSYFLKLKELNDEQLWKDYLEPLLQEYLRGMYNEGEKLKEFESAYKLFGEENDKSNS